MVTITLPPELESAVTERAQHNGTTPELFLLDDLLKRYLPVIPAEPSPVIEPQEGETMADFFEGYVGVLSSSEFVPGGAQMSQDIGRKFREGMVKKRQEGKL